MAYGPRRFGHEAEERRGRCRCPQHPSARHHEWSPLLLRSSISRRTGRITGLFLGTVTNAVGVAGRVCPGEGERWGLRVALATRWGGLVRLREGPIAILWQRIENRRHGHDELENVETSRGHR